MVGRYALYEEIAAGGMATVHFGRLLGPVGFSRTVAIKRLHPQFAKDPEFVSMFLDEARLAARIRHPNVVPTLDVVATQGELFLVMDYVQGESLSRLIRATRERQQRIPVRYVASIITGALHGLHAAHEAKNERGEPLRIVHRDISPQNVLVGSDGVSRVLDFGVAKAAGRMQTTREGQLKGKLSYMAPEQIGGEVTRQTDVYAAAIVLWEALTAQRLLSGDNEGQILAKVLNGEHPPPSAIAPELTPELDAIVLKGLARQPANRYATAREFAIALERCTGLASSTEVGEWVESMAHGALMKRAEKIAEIESSSANIHPQELTTAQVPESLPSHRSGAHPAADPPVSQTSQLSSISVSREAPTVKPRRNLVIGIAGGAMLVIGLIVLLAVKLGHNSDDAHAGAAASDTTHATATETTVPPPTTIATIEPLATQASAPATATATATATAAATATHASPRHTSTSVAPPPPTATATATATSSKNCDPPYTLDAKGHKIWKRECM
ncbi:MAG TPA: serine/threonine-protein kinase [Polyangiaceae bacterium]|nr:serine/threonine-protein kinase [Polyangiaceae bacterium]